MSQVYFVFVFVFVFSCDLSLCDVIYVDVVCACSVAPVSKLKDQFDGFTFKDKGHMEG